MEIILKEDIQGLGYKNDIVKVKPGYGRNFLIPKGFAVMATASARKVLAENIKQAAHKAAKIKQDAQELATKLEAVSISIAAKVSEAGKIFGSITTIQIADAFEKQGIAVDRRKISFVEKEIKSVGEFSAIADLHREVKATIKFKVVAAE